MSQWGWTPARNVGIWRYGAGWIRPVAAAIPYLTVILLVLMMHMVGGTLMSSKGVLFDLPDETFVEGEETGLVALVMPVQRETMVMFDDVRYLIGDAVSMRSLSESLAECAARQPGKSLLILADRRVSTGHLMEVVSASIIDGRIAKGKKAERKTVVLLVALAMFIISIPICADQLGIPEAEGALWPLYSYLADGSKDLLDFYDMLTEGLMMPLGACLMCILIGWKTGFGWMKEEVTLDGKPWKCEKFFKVCVKYITPILMAFVLVSLFLSYLGL